MFKTLCRQTARGTRLKTVLIHLNQNSRRTLLTWVLIFCGWTILALLFSGPSFIQAVRTSQIRAGWFVLGTELTYSYIWLILTPFAIWCGRKFRIEGRERLRNLTLHLLASALLLLVHSALYLVISIPLGGPYSEIVPVSARYFYIVLDSAPVNVVFYWVIIIVHHAVDYYRKYQERELRASQLEAQLARSELQVLKMQLHPHFFFNTLNTISALIHESPDEADEMITQLGDLLRITLETAKVQEVPLTQELEFLKHYVAIEQMRFQDRLKVTIAVEPSTLDAMVPNLILQPLVENSIRHGIAQRPEAQSIEVKAWHENGLLRLQVSDDGPGLSYKLPRKEGVGLGNTRARIDSLYGKQHRLTLRNSRGGGLIVDLWIPFNTPQIRAAEV